MKVFKTKINRNKGLSYDFEVIRFDVVSVKVYLKKQVRRKFWKSKGKGG